MLLGPPGARFIDLISCNDQTRTRQPKEITRRQKKGQEWWSFLADVAIDIPYL